MKRRLPVASAPSAFTRQPDRPPCRDAGPRIHGAVARRPDASGLIDGAFAMSDLRPERSAASGNWRRRSAHPIWLSIASACRPCRSNLSNILLWTALKGGAFVSIRWRRRGQNLRSPLQDNSSSFQQTPDTFDDDDHLLNFLRPHRRGASWPFLRKKPVSRIRSLPMSFRRLASSCGHAV